MGSRLHFGSDGILYAYAQWPDDETRAQAVPASPDVAKARFTMTDCTETAFPEVRLEFVRDFLVR